MITVDATGIDAAEEALAAFPGAVERAVVRALNRASLAGRTAAVKGSAERYAVRQRDVRERISIAPATRDELEITIKSTSGSISMTRFPHTPTAAGTGGPGRRPLRVEIKRGGKVPVRGAFIAPLNSGLRIMIRTGQRTASGKAAIASLYTVPIGIMMGASVVRAGVEERALEVFDQRLAHEVDRAMEERS